ncbi:MAG: hypothetical protein A2Y14_05905 [Verrucomicrobia bacterium GWF2_51_19]|nr:MAG: hypothetical protein A2Y14_05905 [Verrucomicrobia bacterium GWF2_51_19]
MILLSLKPGNRARIEPWKTVPESSLLRCQEMGLLPGVEIEFIRRAPLGSPVEIRINDFHLVLQEEIASYIEVTLI